LGIACRLDRSLPSPRCRPTFSPNPFTDICRAILELDVIHFADGKKLDSIAVDERDVPQIQGNLAADVFQLEEPSQLVNILCLDSTAESENDFSICLPLDSEHPMPF
jgi:hypothetical protein